MTEFEIARAHAPYHDDSMVGEITTGLAQLGHHIFQIFRLAEDDAVHIALLSEMARFPVGARVLDIGCGTGAVAELMHAARPDLLFVLQNCSASQLAMCPPKFERMYGDMHELDIPDGSIDAAMVNYAMGHGDLPRFLNEAARVLRPGGVFFAFDLTHGDRRKFAERMGYVPHAPEDVTRFAEAAGFGEIEAAPVRATLYRLFRTWCAASPELYALLAEATPMVYRFVKL